MSRISQEALNQLFLKTQTSHGFDTSKPVSDELLKELYELTKYPPTCFNCQPLRIVFAKSNEAKQKVVDTVMEGNKKQTSEAAVVAILAYDENFVEHLPKLSPAYDAKAVFEANPSWISPQMHLNANLSAGYFIIAARSLGLEVGPMTGLDLTALEKEFFHGTTQKPFLVVNLGYPTDPKAYYPRAPRFEFDEANRIL